MRKTKLKYSETTFLGLLKIVGFKEFFNFSMLNSIILTILFWKFILQNNDVNSFELLKIISPILLGAAATIFGISLAALSVTISVFYKPALPQMLETKLLHKYLFPFWKTVFLWGIIILVSFFLMITTNIDIKNIPFVRTDITLLFIFFLFTYAVFYTIRLTGEVIRLTLISSQKT